MQSHKEVRQPDVQFPKLPLSENRDNGLMNLDQGRNSTVENGRQRNSNSSNAPAGNQLVEIARTFTKLATTLSSSMCISGGVSSDLTKKSLCGFDPDGLDEGVILDWRRAPSQSFTDWTLVVSDGTTSHSYHVHKSVLSYGSRRSMYFVKEFEKASRKFNGVESGTMTNAKSTTEVALPKLAALCIPLLLDFIYFDKLKFQTETALPLYFLSNYFVQRTLHTRLDSFVRSHLSLKTVVIYLAHANELNEKEWFKRAMKMIAENFHRISTKALIEYLPPQLFHLLICTPSMACPSELLSETIATYCQSEKRSMDISEEIFYFVTHSQILPRISSRPALWFLSFGHKNFPHVLVDENLGGYEGTLKRRCVLAICRDWSGSVLDPIRELVDQRRNRDKDDGDRDNIGTNCDSLDNYKKLPTDIRMEILEEVLVMIADYKKEGGNIQEYSIM